MLQFYPWEMCAILRMQQSRPFVWSTLEESNKKKSWSGRLKHDLDALDR